MSRIITQHGDKGTVGGDFSALPKGEYNCVIMGFKDKDPRNTKTGMVNVLGVELAVADGEYEERLIFDEFWLRSGDERSEEKMQIFLEFAGGLDTRLEAEMPNGNSWLDEASIEWIKLNALNKALKVDVFIEKYTKTNGDPGQANRVSAYSKAGGVAGQSTQAGSISGTGTGSGGGGPSID